MSGVQLVLLKKPVFEQCFEAVKLADFITRENTNEINDC